MSLYCNICQNIKLNTNHICPAQWIIWPLGADEGSARVIYADDAQAAAEKWAKSEDEQGDYTIIKAGEDRCWVRKNGSDDKPVLFDITAESCPKYTASEATK